MTIVYLALMHMYRQFFSFRWSCRRHRLPLKLFRVHLDSTFSRIHRCQCLDTFIKPSVTGMAPEYILLRHGATAGTAHQLLGNVCPRSLLPDTPTSSTMEQTNVTVLCRFSPHHVTLR